MHTIKKVENLYLLKAIEDEKLAKAVASELEKKQKKDPKDSKEILSNASVANYE